MCGVVGYVPSDDPNEQENKGRFRRLMRESAVRGLHAWGIAQLHGHEVIMFKRHRLEDGFYSPEDFPFRPDLRTIGHTRYSTSGDWNDHENNQPVRSGHTLLVFNGVVDMGTKLEMEQKYGMVLLTGNDGEVAIELGHLNSYYDSPIEFRIDKIPGTFAGIWMNQFTGYMYAARNKHRPLYRVVTEDCSEWVASTADIFRRAGFQQTPVLLPTDRACEVYPCHQ